MVSPKSLANLKRDAGPGRPKGSKNRITLAVKELAEEILDDEYMERLKQRVKAGKASHMETLLWHYAKGKPKGDDLDGPEDRAPIRVQILQVLSTDPEARRMVDALAVKALPDPER